MLLVYFHMQDCNRSHNFRVLVFCKIQAESKEVVDEYLKDQQKILKS